VRKLWEFLVDKVIPFAREFWPVLVPAALGLTAVYLLLPRARRYPALWGGLLGGLAVVAAGWWLVQFQSVSPEAILFYAFAGIAIVSAGVMITQSNPVHAALAFAMVVLSTCGLFLLLAAPFLMAATIIIYAGAIIVTFLFVIMLAQQHGASNADQRSREPFLATVAGLVLLTALLSVLLRTYQSPVVQAEGEQLVLLLDQARRVREADPLPNIHATFERNEEFFQKLVALMDVEQKKEVDTTDPVRMFFNEFLKLMDNEKLLPGQAAATRQKMKTALLLAEQDWGDVRFWEGRVEAEARATKTGNDRKAPATAAAKVAAKVTDFKFHLGEVLREGQALLALLKVPGMLPPDPDLPASPFSTGRFRERLRDEQGQLQLPAENASSLGRSLFTDYLLAFEVAGFLLLVATIGAIAIVARRTETLR
jgi:NADH:ubiquinone oxidoreductase subunit 6 (subunit J)